MVGSVSSEAQAARRPLGFEHVSHDASHLYGSERAYLIAWSFASASGVSCSGASPDTHRLKRSIRDRGCRYGPSSRSFPLPHMIRRPRPNKAMELTAIRRRTTVPNRWLAKLSPLGMPVSVSRYELGRIEARAMPSWTLIAMRKRLK